MKKTINYSEIHHKMLEDLKQRTGILNANALILNAIVDYHSGYFPAYVKNTQGLPNETPLEKAERKANEKKLLKEAEEKAKLAPKIEMCEKLLGGTIEINENGYKFCKFTQYRAFGDDQSCSIPLLQVAPIIAETSLFIPDKQTIFSKRKEIKKLFEKLNE